jgi:hypothetical protein
LIAMEGSHPSSSRQRLALGERRIHVSASSMDGLRSRMFEHRPRLILRTANSWPRVSSRSKHRPALMTTGGADAHIAQRHDLVLPS